MGHGQKKERIGGGAIGEGRRGSRFRKTGEKKGIRSTFNRQGLIS